MLEAVRTEQMENLECMEDVVVNMIEEAMANAKYKIGDKVYYLDTHKIKKAGTIADITYTEIYPWNDKIKPLYLINGFHYLRAEEEILGLVKE